MIKKTISDIIKNFDFFSQPVTFRFNDQSAYQSITGGIVSIGLIILFAALFTTTILETFQKTNVDGKTTKIQQEDPSYSAVKTDSLMFGVGITGVNLNVGTKWFDVYFEKNQYQGKIKTTKQIKLVQCQKQQWTNIKPSLASTYDRIGIDNWLCPPPGLQMQLQGKYLSEVFSFYKITVRQCNSSNATPDRPCVSNDTIQTFLKQEEFFKFNFYFTNTILNPGNQDYIQKYLDDSNYYPFTTKAGLAANFYISSYNISTDQSISPLSDTNTKAGFICDVPTQMQYYQLRSQNYIKFYIRKSSFYQNIERSFRKADDTLSYIGGLFSAILFLLFIIAKYNEYSYELEVAKNLFHYEKNRPLNSRSFNFLVFLGYVIYLFFQKICIQLPWRTMQKFHRSLEEVRKQMDIRLLMKKVIYAERMAIAIFDLPKAKILHLQQPLTLEQAQQIRKDHRFYQKIQHRYFDYRKIREQDKLLELSNEKVEQSEIINEQKNEQSYSSLKRISKNEEKIQINSIILRNKQQKIILPKQKSRKKSIKIKSIPKITDQGEQKRQKITQQEIKQLQFNEMIEKMKEYLQVLEVQSKNGDMISQKILNRFDNKIMDILTKNKKENIQVYDLNQLMNGNSNQKLAKL